MKERKKRGQEVQLQSYNQLSNRVYIDKNAAIEMGLTIEDLQRMAA
jgi:hypothetical protein